MPKFIDIIIDTEGGYEIETSGFKGRACQQATQDYENELGGVENETIKPEFREKPVEERVQQKRSGG